MVCDIKGIGVYRVIASHVSAHGILRTNRFVENRQVTCDSLVHIAHAVSRASQSIATPGVFVDTTRAISCNRALDSASDLSADFARTPKM
jgi:hypothetical protein